MSKDQQTASQFAGTEEAASPDASSPLPTAADPTLPPQMRRVSQAATTGQRKQVSSAARSGAVLCRRSAKKADDRSLGVCVSGAGLLR